MTVFGDIYQKLLIFEMSNIRRYWTIIWRYLTIETFTMHDRLACDIYCAHACLRRYDSTLFYFEKLKPRRLIFLINCRSNLTINIVNRAKKMKNEWLTMPTLTKENVIFDFKLSPGWFSVAEEAEVDAHDWNQRNWKRNVLKSGCDRNPQNIRKNMIFV